MGANIPCLVSRRNSCASGVRYIFADVWAVCDQNKLTWLRSHQQNLRADLYNGITDVLVREDIDLNMVGRKVILPSSFVGGDRFMQQLYQDNMAIVRHFGRPSLFITFTANPKWIEIQQELLEGLTVVDRPDLVARVFKMKKDHLINQISHQHIFGPFLAQVWTIEYQKRGLPHLHLLVFLQTDAQFLTTETIDNVICAELPQESTEQGRDLGQLIKTSMVPTSCAGGNLNAACMTTVNIGQVPTCSKRYPRAFQPETVILSRSSRS